MKLVKILLALAGVVFAQEPTRVGQDTLGETFALFLKARDLNLHAICGDKRHKRECKDGEKITSTGNGTVGDGNGEAWQFRNGKLATVAMQRYIDKPGAKGYLEFLTEAYGDPQHHDHAEFVNGFGAPAGTVLYADWLLPDGCTIHYELNDGSREDVLFQSKEYTAESGYDRCEIHLAENRRINPIRSYDKPAAQALSQRK
jgi:hypothetical protein